MPADIVSPAERSRMMAAIKGKNTKPELAIRSALHRAGFRFRLHRRDLPGRPDMVFTRYNAVMFIHGCFWHGHDCHLFRWPATRTAFWRDKINGNINRDRRQYRALRDAGWRVATIWECALKGRARRDFPSMIEDCMLWLRSDDPELEIRGA